jgi:hypothetical protein
MNRAAAGFCLLLLAATPVPAAVPLAEVWETLANHRPDQALPRFEKAAAGAPADRLARFGTALSLLAQQSARPDRVEHARVLLSALSTDGTDDVALGARFFLARLAQFQAEPRDPALAAVEFRRLVAEHGESAWAQAAVPRLAILLLYTEAGPAGAVARVAAAEKLQGYARSPAAVTELHLVIADAVFHHRLPENLALPHLLAAEKAGAMDVPTRGDTLVQIGELSRLAGDAERAAEFYRKFLAEFPRDSRQYAVRQKLAALEKGR